MNDGRFLTDEQVEQEIERLRNSPLVALARKETRIRYKRRQALYQLRALEKRGAALLANGITMEILQRLGEDALNLEESEELVCVEKGVNV